MQSMEDLIKTIKLSEDIFALNGSENFIDGQSYTWRVFVTGDHMCIYKLLGADGPTSLLAHRQPCPYCNIPADKLRNYREPIRPMVRKPGALLRHPVNQFPVDMAHGLVNILFTIVLSLCSQLLQTYKGLSKKETTELFDSLVCGRADLIEEPRDAEQAAHSLERSIDAARLFFRNKQYLRLVDAFNLVRKDFNHQGTRYTCHHLVRALLSHCDTMYSVSYTRKPVSKEDQKRFCTAASQFGALLSTMDGKGTVWGHVWVAHGSQFLTTWGTLYPFLCHGVEGRHRWLKREVALSARGQMKGGKVGFEAVIRHSIVLVALLKRGVKLSTWTRHVNKKNKIMFDAFIAHVKTHGV